MSTLWLKLIHVSKRGYFLSHNQIPIALQFFIMFCLIYELFLIIFLFNHNNKELFFFYYTQCTWTYLPTELLIAWFSNVPQRSCLMLHTVACKHLICGNDLVFDVEQITNLGPCVTMHV